MRALNWSTLKHIAKSPMHYRYRLDHPEPDAPHYLWGRAVHCALLEPEAFDARYAVCDVKKRWVKADVQPTKDYAAWLDDHPDAEPLKPVEMVTVQMAARSVLNHRVAAGVLAGCRHEEPLEWTDPDTGLACRGRVDAISQYVLDVKTAQSCEPRLFQMAAARYAYHGQLALYHTGATVLRKIDGKTPPYIIAIEKSPPYDVAVYQMSLEDLAAGRALVLSLMRRLEECTATDMWPGCAPDLLQLQLPPWAGGLEEESEDW